MEKLIVCSIITQFVVDRLKFWVLSQWRPLIVPLMAVATGLIVSFSTKISIFQMLDIEVAYPVLDYILSGVAISGGSVAVNELLKSLMEKRPSNFDGKEDGK